MRKLAIALVVVMLFVSVGAGTAFAGGRHHGGGGFGGWFIRGLGVGTGIVVAETILGGGRYGGYGYQPYGYQQPVYYYQPPPPVCWVEQSPVFDAYGRLVGSMPVQRCAQPY